MQFHQQYSPSHHRYIGDPRYTIDPVTGRYLVDPYDQLNYHHPHHPRYDELDLLRAELDQEDRIK